MLPSDIRSMQEAYQNIYEESDLLTDDLIEEIVEELVEECLEFGYSLNESADAVEAAAILYIDEAKVTYGSDTESPEQRSARAKDRLGDMKASKRKAAVKGAVDRVKSTAQGVKAAAGIAGSIAKDEVTRARRTASHAVQKKKAEVKGGIKKMIGGGLRAVAGGIGKVAQRAAGAASKFGEEVELGENRAMARDPEGRKSGHSKQPDPSKPGFTGIGNMSIAQIAKMSAKIGKDKKQNEEVEIDEANRAERELGLTSRERTRARNLHQNTDTPIFYKKKNNALKDRSSSTTNAAHKNMAAKRRENASEEVEIYDVVLEYLMSEGYADTIAEAEYIMTELDSEMVNQILEEVLDEDAKYDANRRRAAQRAAARNAARDAGKTGAVPGVGYVTPRRESETYRDSTGTERHKSGARMPEKKG